LYPIMPVTTTTTLATTQTTVTYNLQVLLHARDAY